jgi:MutS domain V
MKARLLHPGQDFGFAGELPPNSDDLIGDLELNILLAAMADADKFLRDVAIRVLLAPLADPDAIRYRQAVLADCIAEPDLVRELYGIATGALADKRSVWGFLSSQNPSSTLSGAVGQLQVLTVRLRQLRRFADDHGGKFRSEGFTQFIRTAQAELDDGYLDELGHHLKQLRFPAGQLISADLGRDNSGISYTLRSGSARRRLAERIGIAPRTVYTFSIHPRDDAGAQALEAMTSRAINHVANAAAQSADHISNFFAALRAELAFYLGCLNLHSALEASGQPLTFPDPEPLPACELNCADLRDVCLALRTGRVVGNDIGTGGAPLVVLTGANSGGKSTFLRSVGVAQLMMQAGMFVTAAAFRSSLCRGVFTHFIREEDKDLVSGRLDEELARMSAIAGQVSPGSIVLFNESFAATNEREGSEIGRQVVTALLEAGIRVFFVTHHFDLADSLRRQSAFPALFLRAPRQPDGRRTFKLTVDPPLPTSYGADIYHRIGGWLGEHDGQAQAGQQAGLRGGERGAGPGTPT